MRRIGALSIACASALALAWVQAAPLPAAPGAAVSSPDPQSRSCLTCHASAAGALTGPMATRADERAFAHRAFGPVEGERFFEQSCSGCHVSACSDCHGAAAHPVGRPRDEACLRCHRGDSVGAAYHGRAPREDHPRYQRGPQDEAGEHYLKMLPDVHQERGMTCADCHRMGTHGHDAKTSTRGCRDCHPAPDPKVPEHAIGAHLEKMRCSACHAAWAAQEYATVLVRPRTEAQQEAFAVLPQIGEWRRSAAHRRQDAPPLGLDGAGLVAPIRPKHQLFATDPSRGWENRLLAAEWVPFEPHTVRAGTVACGGCHDQPRRFVLEADADRILRPDLDGLALRSFWNREGQAVRGGAFLPGPRHAAMNRKTPVYLRETLRQWQRLLAAQRSAR